MCPEDTDAPRFTCLSHWLQLYCRSQFAIGLKYNWDGKEGHMFFALISGQFLSPCSKLSKTQPYPCLIIFFSVRSYSDYQVSHRNHVIQITMFQLNSEIWGSLRSNYFSLQDLVQWNWIKELNYIKSPVTIGVCSRIELIQS